MKNLFILMLIPVILASCTMKKGNGYTIHCKITGIEKGKAYLQKYEDGKWIKTDSSGINQGEFTFTGKVDMPESRYLNIEGKSGFFQFFIENSDITIRANADSLDIATIKGSASQEFYSDYLKLVEPLKKQQKDIYDNYLKAKEAGNKKLTKKFDSIMTALDNETTKTMEDFIGKNPKAVVSPYLLASNSWRFELGDLEKYFSVIDTSLNKSVYVQKVKNRIEILKKVAVGMQETDFTLNDTNGKAISLSSFKGKYVLIDFWASWCPDCRAENPNVVDCYKEFHSKGLEILGVSLDKDKVNWIKAIRADKLIWTQISDLKRWDNAAAKLYGINSIPSNVLIDKEGKIIAKNMTGKDIIKKLKETLNHKS